MKLLMCFVFMMSDMSAEKCEVVEPIRTIYPRIPKNEDNSAKSILDDKDALDIAIDAFLQRKGPPNDAKGYMERKNALNDVIQRLLKRKGTLQATPLGPLKLNDKTSTLEDGSSSPSQRAIPLGPLKLNDKTSTLEDGASPSQRGAMPLGLLKLNDEQSPLEDEGEMNEMNDENGLQDVMPSLLQRQERSNDKTEYMKKKAGLKEALKLFMKRYGGSQDISENKKDKTAMNDNKAIDNTILIKMQLRSQRAKCQRGNSNNGNKNACPEYFKDSLDDDTAMNDETTLDDAAMLSKLSSEWLSLATKFLELLKGFNLSG
ncbi:unnamed protein product [Diamesa hyperborea]